MLNDHAQNPNRTNSQKNLHTFGRASLLPAEQKECHPGSKGCKDKLMISKAIYEECSRRNKNLSTAWIDYQKAFDSIPHSWEEKSISFVGVNSIIIRFCKLSMENWNTRLFLKKQNRT